MDVGDHLFEYVCVCVLTRTNRISGVPQCPCVRASSGKRQRGDVFPACSYQGNQMETNLKIQYSSSKVKILSFLDLVLYLYEH